MYLKSFFQILFNNILPIRGRVQYDNISHIHPNDSNFGRGYYLFVPLIVTKQNREKNQKYTRLIVKLRI